MQLKIIFNTSDVILVTLFDNPAITKWFNHFSKVNAEKNIYTIAVESLPCRNPLPLDDCEKHWTTILTSVDHLRSIGYDYNLTIPDRFDYNQQTLNRLHRFFTYNFIWATQHPNTPNPFDPKFKLSRNTNWKIWHELVDPINRAVHKLEKFTKTTANRSFIDTQLPMHSISFVNNYEDFDNHLLNFDNNDVEQNYSFFNYDQPNLVTLDRSILGKCILQSFCEDDDPTAQDCTGRLVSWGGFNIDLNDNRKKIYESAQFVEWAERYKLKNIPYEFPIGYVASSTRPLLDFDKMHDRLRSIRFLGSAGEIRTHGFTDLQSDPLGHSGTAL